MAQPKDVRSTLLSEGGKEAKKKILALGWRRGKISRPAKNWYGPSDASRSTFDS
jgi:hypothetical protein